MEMILRERGRLRTKGLLQMKGGEGFFEDESRIYAKVSRGRRRDWGRF